MAGEADRTWAGSMPEAYDRWLVPAVFRPFAVDLARRVASHDPRRVLELAAGTGALTRELVAAVGGGAVTATDLNAAMVAHGRAGEPRAEWRQADAEDLPFGDDEFDAVTCQFGAMFFPDKVAAFAEARRVLAPSGTMLLNTWARLDEHRFQAALVAALERVFPAGTPTFMGAVPHGYSDADLVAADLAAAGLRCTRVEQLTLEAEAPSARSLATGYCQGTPLRAELEERGDLGDLTAAVALEMEADLGPGPVRGRMTAHIVEADAGTEADTCEGTFS